jgi:pyruvate decarboxylase
VQLSQSRLPPTRLIRSTMQSAARCAPVLMIGSKLRAAGAEKQAIELAEALGCAVAVIAAAKSFFPEDHPQFAGIYWGEVSSPGAREIVDWSDSVVCVGTISNDYSTVGWTAVPSGANLLTADQHRVFLEGHDFGRIHLRDFLSGLASEVQKRPATMVEYQRIRSQPQSQQPTKPDAKLKRTEIFRQVQALINPDTTVIAETGDSWFNGMALRLPSRARFEIEMQWGSIGSSVPATFGYAVGESSSAHYPIG